MWKFMDIYRWLHSRSLCVPGGTTSWRRSVRLTFTMLSTTAEQRGATLEVSLEESSLGNPISIPAFIEPLPIDLVRNRGSSLEVLLPWITSRLDVVERREINFTILKAIAQGQADGVVHLLKSRDVMVKAAVNFTAMWPL